MTTDRSVRDDIASALGQDYEIVRELGRGGASVVYLGRDRVLGREVAIKVIRDSQAGDREAVARFEREARTLAALQHPNIVMLYGARQLSGGSLALVMQHGEWSTLKALIRERGPLPIEAVEQVLQDVATALGYLHKHEVIHRDIKPENIFIEADSGRALLSDFGIAKSRDGRASVTLTGVVIGTPAYMSPEQIDGGQLTGQSDLYSLGMVGYEMLTGERPWEGESLFGVIYKQKTEKLPSIEEKRPDTPQHIRSLIERATEKAPEARWQSADEFLVALSGSAVANLPRPWARSVAPTAVDLPPTEYATLEIEQAAVERTFGEVDRPLRKRRRTMAAAVILLLFSGGAGALAFSGREAETSGGSPASASAAENRGGDDGATGSPPPLTIAVDTPSFALAEPIVDSGPRSRAPESGDEPSSPEATRPGGRAATQAGVARVAEEDSEVDSADVAAPPPLVPSLSISRPVALALQNRAQPITETRQASEPTEAPQLRNRDRIGQLLADRYPSDLRSRGIGGTTMLTVLVGADGRVEGSAVVTSSGSPRLDEAARTVADRMLFDRPPGASAQAVWVAVPLTFDPN